MAYNSVAISGLPGSGKNTLTRRFVETLGWEKFSSGDYWREVHRRDPDGRRNPFDRYFEALAKDKERMAALNQGLVDMVTAGDVVLDSRFIHYLRPETLKVFLRAPLRIRA